MMGLIGYAIFGLVAGAIARLVHPGKDPMNWLWTMLLGVGGAIIGGWGAEQLGFDSGRGLTGWVSAVVGAVALLALYHMMTSRAAATTNPTSKDYKDAVYDDLSRGPNG